MGFHGLWVSCGCPGPLPLILRRDIIGDWEAGPALPLGLLRGPPSLLRGDRRPAPQALVRSKGRPAQQGQDRLSSQASGEDGGPFRQQVVKIEEAVVIDPG